MMQEVLSKTTDSNVPLEEQEYFELRLDDLGFPFRSQFIDILGIVARRRYIVREAHASWSEIDRDIMWEGYEHEECSTHEEAELRYEERRAAIVKKGFIHSDMEF
jgi:hypothetical protein